MDESDENEQDYLQIKTKSRFLRNVNRNTVRKTNKKKLQPKKSLQAAMISPRKALIPKRKTQSPHFSPETGPGVKVVFGRKAPNGKSYTRQNERKSKASKRVQLKSK